MEQTAVYSFSSTAKTRRIGHNCKLCGKREHPDWSPETNERLIKNQICLDCDIWVRTVSQDLINPLWYGKLTIGGKRYSARPLENCSDKNQEVVILENLTTKERKAFCNLKSVGVIPEHFLSMFPDNARIVTETPLVDEVAKPLTLQATP